MSKNGFEFCFTKWKASQLRFTFYSPNIHSLDSCTTCSAFNCDHCRINGQSNLSTDYSRTNNISALGDQPAYQNLNLNQQYSYPANNNNSCAISQPYSNLYENPSTVNNNNAPRSSWSNTAENYIAENGLSATDPQIQIQEMYQFSPLSGDLFQPEEIFQLDQPLNQNKVHRLQSPPQTLLDLGSGTIQLKGTVVANDPVLTAQQNDSQYYSYDPLPLDQTTSTATPPMRTLSHPNKCQSQDNLTPYPYQGSSNSVQNYCDINASMWKDSDENGNHVMKSGSRSLSRKLIPEDNAYQPHHQHSEEFHYSRSLELPYNYQMSCHESQQRMNPCYNQQAAAGVNSPSYFMQSSYLPQEISTGIAADQNTMFGLATSNKSH